jgi:hypothetical protein
MNLDECNELCGHISSLGTGHACLDISALYTRSRGTAGAVTSYRLRANFPDILTQL